MRWAVLAVVATSTTACATSQTNQYGATTTRPMVASVKPMVPDTGAVETRDEDSSAGALLERAFHFFNQDQHDLASRTFAEAIGTNNLNDAGRALAYWHVYLSERRLGHEDASTEALYSFVVVSQDVMEARADTRYAVSDEGDFIDRFNLDARLARARALLSVIWAQRFPEFGRSQGAPVQVHTDTELDYFLELAPPCANSFDRKVARQVLHSTPDNSLEQVTLFCEGQRGGTDYYFERMPAD